jgi:geranylgeranylglycerol-phosphate geranylgeranyltransferase
VKKIKALWQLMRLEHGFMLAIAILIGAIIASKGVPPWDNLFFAFLTALFLEAGTFALNDYFDLEVDMKNKRMDRPLVRGDINPVTAVLIYIIFLPAGIVSSYMVNITCFYIALLNAGIATIYDVKLKEIKVVGNFYIAFVMAIPFVFGGTVISTNLPPIIFLIALISFLSGVGREIMKDVMDFVGDAERETKSFPLYVGKKGANIIASVFYVLAVVMSFIPFFVNIDEAYFHDLIYLSLVLVTDVFLIYISANIVTKTDVKSLGKYRNISLCAIFIGLIAFLIGAFA